MSAEDRFLKGSRLAKLLAGRARPHRVFTLEVVRDAGPEAIILAVRAVSAEEQATAQADAVRWLTSTGGWSREDLLSETGDAMLNLAVMCEVLSRSLVCHDAPDQQFAASSAEIRRVFEVDEIRACFEEFAAFQRERSPFRHMKSLAEVREVADALGKGLISPTNLPRYDSTTLRDIITTLVARGASAMTESSSATSPPTGSSEGSSPNSAPTRSGPTQTLSDEPL